ncbi:MAG: hypothetical protein E7439_05360 [Ruminococcaceae bacterium]|nr:hypothetical protein [Oscillospiraceae bacterium]
MLKKYLFLIFTLSLLAGCASGNTDIPASSTPSLPTEPSESPTEVTRMPGTLDANHDGVVTWYALGDSITQGYYSYFDENGEGKLALNANQGWANLLSTSTGWKLTNSAVGGSGFVHKGTVLDKLTGREHIDTLNFQNAELVTLAFGVNDWKGDDPLGQMDDDIATGGTFYSNMRYCIEKIQKDNPTAKIVVISPINCCRFGFPWKDWGINFPFANNGTLEDIYNAMKQVCDHYSIPLIDVLHNETINGDIKNNLPDGVHPTLEVHARMAEILEEKLLAILPEE